MLEPRIRGVRPDDLEMGNCAGEKLPQKVERAIDHHEMMAALEAHELLVWRLDRGEHFR